MLYQYTFRGRCLNRAETLWEMAGEFNDIFGTGAGSWRYRRMLFKASLWLLLSCVIPGPEMIPEKQEETR
jgi:hypothetical protein